MIDVSIPNTIPTDIRVAVFQYIDTLPDYIKETIKNHTTACGSDFQCAIEKYMRPGKADNLYTTVIDSLERNRLLCFHATRILDENDVRKHGLHTNAPEQYLGYLKATLEKLNIAQTHTVQAVEFIKQEYHRKYNGYKSQLCFFTPLSSVCNEELAGYDQYCQNIGGELARWALKNRMPEVYQQLKSAGIPVIVEFSLPFSDIAHYQKGGIAYAFITYYARKYFGSKESPISFDGTTFKDIPLSQIIKLHHFDKELDYE